MRRRLIELWVWAAVLVIPLHSAAAYTVLSASADVHVNCGTNGTDVPTDWYFPQPNEGRGLIWVQHGFSRANNHFADLSQKLAEQGYIVFATSLAPGNVGCAMNNVGFLSDFSALFPDLADPDKGLLKSAKQAATAAGISLPSLPPSFVFSGHSAGAGSIAYVARKLAENHPTAFAQLAGLAFLDPVESMSDSLIGSSLPFLASKTLTTISSPPYTCNSNASGTVLLTALPRAFVGVRLTSGSHCDSEGSSTDALCTLFCGNPQNENVSILQTLTKNWIADFFNGGQQITYYPGGTYYQSKLAAGRIVTLAENSCGNGALDAGEQCDDGNRNAGDCCDGFCRYDTGGQSCTSDNNVCTNDTCNGSGTCLHTNNQLTCDDAQFCTLNDVCSGGSCGGTPRDCSGLNDDCNIGSCNESVDQCQVQPRTNGTPCNDSSLCTQSDACQGGTCTGANPIVCVPSAACHLAGTCNPATGVCSTPTAADGTPCSDGDPCTLDDRCTAGVCNASPHCGDGTLQTGCGEACDGGVGNGNDACCSATCQIIDGDGDGSCDRDDPCTSPAAINKAKLSLRGIFANLPDDKLLFSGEMILPFPFIPGLDPTANGLRIIVSNSFAVTLDVTLPAGGYSSLLKRGWKQNSTATKWGYADHAALPPGGVYSAKVHDASSKVPGLVKFKIKGKTGPYPVPVGSLPLTGTLILAPPAAPAGACGTASFPGPEPTPHCDLDSAGNTVKCK